MYRTRGCTKISSYCCQLLQQHNIYPGHPLLRILKESKSTQKVHTMATQNMHKQSMDDEYEKFDSVFDILVKDLETEAIKHPETSAAVSWFRRAFMYNVPHGKKNRGMSLVTSYKHLVKEPKEEDLHIARLLGWAVEFLQAFFLVGDDIIDQSITRRGQPCWYKQPDVGLTAFNDSCFLENFSYQIVMKYVREKPYYTSVLELFLNVDNQTLTGECLDLITAPQDGTVDFTKFTMDKYSAIVKWKTSFYSFYFPVAVALYMAGISDKESHEQAKEIFIQMGHYFQVQDDYLDCYGDPEVTGKIGTDIEDNKCSWLIITALETASDEQIQILKTNYGQKNQSAVSVVKELYRQLDIKGKYQQYETQTRKTILDSINKNSGPIPKDIFLDFAKKIFGRNK